MNERMSELFLDVFALIWAIGCFAADDPMKKSVAAIVWAILLSTSLIISAIKGSNRP